jgi:hypothetical protein
LAGAYELVEFPLKRIFHKRRAQDAASIAFMPDTFSGSGGLNLPIRKLQRLKESMTRIANALTGANYSVSIQKSLTVLQNELPLIDSGLKNKRGNKKKLMSDDVIRITARSLKEQFSRGSEAWKEQSDPI